MNRRGSASIVANPVLVGAVTTLVVVVAVFLAYNANNGLPFVPTRVVNVQVDNGAELVPGNEVRSGGYRIGVVQDMNPVKLANGKVGALLKLKLDQKFGAVPVDSQVIIRPRSSLGLKYVEFQRGTSKKTIADGGLLDYTHSKVPVELDEFYNMFDAKTRRAAQVDLQGFGDGLTGRGYDLNVAIQHAPGFFGHLTNVMANLSAPQTDLKTFFKELDDTVRIIAPVSAVNVAVFRDMAITFEAFSRDTQALKDTISKNPPTLAAGTESFRVQRPFLAETADFSHDLRFAASDLRDALPSLNSALKIGIPVTRRSTQQYQELQDTLNALQGLADAPTTNGAVRGLSATMDTLRPQLRFLGPFVTVCNYWNTFWTFNAEHFTAPDATGGAERALLNDSNNDPDNVTSMGANEFVHGVAASNPADNQKNGGRPQHVHNNTTGGYAIHPDGRANCEKGQQGYAYGLNRFRPAGYDAYARAAVDQPVDAPTPDFGSTFKSYDINGHGIDGLNAPRVPAGETFSQNPGGTGAQLPSGGLPNKVQKKP
ncbi:MAG: phospholipid/cholesterol/gamma-HCH transport system substrate-binding protein [Solirubrobacteraceae bacterium]|jgi:ABC-type transporter Mla subunit MlaD|nr:phospholipid/cholesterol/gamma-HCH transport system substrate-binding protein [Solirubrobacteraceae bacterium]